MMYHHHSKYKGKLIFIVAVWKGEVWIATPETVNDGYVAYTNMIGSIFPTTVHLHYLAYLSLRWFGASDLLNKWVFPHA